MNTGRLFYTRATAELELTTRAATLAAPATVNEEERSIETVIATEQPVVVYDYNRGELIEEILRTDGAEYPAQVVFLTDHRRYGVENVIGSVRSISTEDDQVVGRLHYSDDDWTETVWRKTKAGHLRDVSAGYRVLEYQDVEPGKTATIGGKPYTAGRLTLRVTTRWQLREVSAVPIGADDRAKTRTAPDSFKETAMPAQLRAYLLSIGLRADATEAEAWTFYRKIQEADQRKRADELLGDVTPPTADDNGQRAPPADPPATPPEGQRSAQTPEPGRSTPADNGQAAGQPDAAVLDQARRAERERCQRIRAMADETTPRDLVDRAINEEWSVDRAGREFWEVRTSSRSDSVGQAPAGHVHGNESAEMRREALAVSMVIRQGLDPIASQQTIAEQTGRRLTQAVAQQREQAADMADRYRALSLMDLAREAIQVDGRHVPVGDQDEFFRAAFSGGTLSYIFTTSVNAAVIRGFAEAPDTTAGMYKPASAPNFKTMDRMRLQKGGRLDKLPRGKTADLADYSDLQESYKIARFAKKAVIDEQDLIDDSHDVLNETPRMIGANARRLIPDIFYSILLANNSLSDSVALFHATHKNLGTAALGETGLKAAVTAMGNQREGGIPLNITPAFLVCPLELQFAAAELIKAATIVITGDTDSVRGAKNVLADLNLQIRADSRLNATGVYDPQTETTLAGSTTNWGLLASPTQGPTIEIATLLATGKAPQIRSFVLDQGTWGRGWDIKFDVGGKGPRLPRRLLVDRRRLILTTHAKPWPTNAPAGRGRRFLLCAIFDSPTKPRK